MGGSKKKVGNVLCAKDSRYDDFMLTTWRHKHLLLKSKKNISARFGVFGTKFVRGRDFFYICTRVAVLKSFIVTNC